MPARVAAHSPLYKQVKEMVVADIAAGRWRGGELMPSEFALADEFRVSQGTVRRALDELAAEKVIQRRQGVGTTVVENTPQQNLFAFFPVRGDDGARFSPTSRTLGVRAAPAPARTCALLGLAEAAPVAEIRRVRYLRGRLALFELIHLPLPLFAGIELASAVPDTLYHLYQTRFGVKVQRVEDRVKAVAASGDAREVLRVRAKAPLLAIERVAYAMTGEAIEHRNSWCLSDHYHYFSELS